ncbi:MAG: GntR family transcriptional regulator [Deltaproteobacteria bacterium]
MTKTVVELLRKNIITGQLPAKQRLSEVDLAHHLQISRAPLREAFRVLEEDQLVVSTPRRGCYVTDVSSEDFVQLYQAREMIEVYAIDLLKVKGIKQLPEVEKALSDAAGLAMPGEKEPAEEKLDYILAFAAFHDAIVGSSENRQLIHFYRRIGFHLARYQFMYAYLPGLTVNSQRQHDEICTVIKKGQYAHAKKLIKVHIKSFVDLMEDKINESMSTAPSFPYGPAVGQSDKPEDEKALVAKPFSEVKVEQ